MAANIYTEILSLGRAKVLTDTLAGQTNDETVILRFENIPNNQLEAAADWLYSNRISIENFRSEYKTYDGTWRSVEIKATKINTQGGYIDQTFAFGYIETLLSETALDWTEARTATRKSLVAGPDDNGYTSPATGDDTTEEYLTVVWPNCSPYKAEAMLAEVNALGASSFDPVLRGETYSTGWHRINSGYEIADDGSATFTLYLAHPEFSIDTYEGWLTEKQANITYHFNVPKELAQTIVDNYKAKGARASITYNDGLCGIIIVKRTLTGSTLDAGTTADSCDSQSYARMYMSIEDPSIYTVPDPEAGMTYKRRVSSNNDGTYDVNIESTYRQTRNYDDRETSVSALSDTSIRRQFGVTDDSSIPDISLPAQGRVYRQNVSIQPDCSKNIETTTEDARDLTGEFKSLSTQFKRGDSVIYRNTDTLIDAPTITGAGSYRVQQQINDDGTYNAVLVYERGTNAAQEDHESMNSSLGEQDTILYKAANESVNAPSSGQGAIYRANNTLREDGLYDATLTYNKSLPAIEEFKSATSSAGSSDSAIYRNADALISAPAAGQGAIYKVQQQINEDGTYDATLVYDKSTSQIAEYRSSATIFLTGNSIIYRNSASSINAPTVTGSGQYRVQQQVNRDGTYDAVLVYETGTNTGEFEHEALNSALLERDNVIYRARTSGVDAPSSVQGAIYRADNSLRDDGLYDASLTYEKSNSATLAFDSNRTPFRKESSIIYRNTTASIAATLPNSGMYRSTNRINPDGTYDSTLIYSSGTNVGEESFNSTRSGLEDRDSVLYRSRTTSVNAPNSVQGAVYRAENSLRDDGLYDASLLYVESTPVTLPRTASRTPFSTTDGIIYRNSTDTVDAPTTTSGIYRVTERINNDGTYDADLTYEHSTDSGEASFESANSPLSERNSVIYRNRSTQVAAADPVQGGIYRSENSLGDNGLYQSSLTYDKSSEVSTTVETENGPVESSTQIIYKNSRKMPKLGSVPTNGNIYRMRVSINEDGTYDADMVYTETSEASHEFKSLDTGVSTEHSISYRRSAAPIVGGDDSQQNVYRVNQSIADDGTYSGTMMYKTSDAISHKQNFYTRNGIGSWIHAFRNAKSTGAIAAELPVYGNNSLRIQINDDKTYSGVAIYEIPSGSGATVKALDSVHWTDKQVQTIGSSMYRIWTVVKYVNYHKSHGLAESAADNGFEGSISFTNDLWKAMYQGAPTVTGTYLTTLLV